MKQAKNILFLLSTLPNQSRSCPPACQRVTFPPYCAARPKRIRHAKANASDAEQKTKELEKEKGSFSELSVPQLGRQLSVEVKSLSQENAMLILDLLEEKVRPTIIQYNMVLSMLTKTKTSVESARMVYERMERNRVPPNMRTFASMISVFGKAGQWRDAAIFFNTLKSQGYTPNSYCINSVIDALARAKEVKLALDYAQLLKDCKIPAPEGTSTIGKEIKSKYDDKRSVVDPNILVGLNSTLNACASCGLWNEALELLESMERSFGVKPDVRSYSSAMAALEPSGQFEKGLELLGKMKLEGVQPNKFTYSSLICACSKENRWEKALEVAEMMEAEGVVGDVVSYSALIDALGKGRQFERAEEVLEGMRIVKLKPNVITYNSLMNALGKAGKLEQASRLLRTMKKHGVQADATSYNSLISACAHNNAVTMAFEFLREMEARNIGVDVVTLNTALSVCMKAKTWKRAEKVLESFQERGIEPDIISYNTMLACYNQGKQWKRALVLLTSMEDRGVAPDIISYNSVLSVLDKNEKCQAALELLRLMSTSDSAPNPDVVSYSCILNCFKKTSRADEAVKLLKTMESEHGIKPNAYSYMAVIDACDRCGMSEEAAQLLEVMRLRRQEPDYEKYRATGRVLERIQKRQQVAEFLSERAEGSDLDFLSLARDMTGKEKNA
mmetsp:Transcript_4632/g.11965  ORF Transcript_4632/g.11965 Transcript_4632/m.11965 type:complete len:673 (+) Transcript_4632:111-2129(+)